MLTQERFALHPLLYWKGAARDGGQANFTLKGDEQTVGHLSLPLYES